MMEIFDKQFVHFMWDDSLIGKEGFLANDIDTLIECVEENNVLKRGVVTGEHDYVKCFPFRSENGKVWMFFYYDPLYWYKWVHKALLDGKRVQWYLPLSGWVDIDKDHVWDYSSKYRILDIATGNDFSNKLTVLSRDQVEEKHKSKLLTYKQLAKWLANGNGQAYITTADSDRVVVSFNYNLKFEDNVIDESWFVRRWDDDVWHTPTMDYCFPKEEKQ